MSDNDLFSDDDSEKKPSRLSTRRTGAAENNALPTLSRLCLLKVRGLRARLEGLTYLPEELVFSIVEGSSSDELKQIEISNPDASTLPIWDGFWQTLCDKAMVSQRDVLTPAFNRLTPALTDFTPALQTPSIAAAKPEEITWFVLYRSDKRMTIMFQERLLHSSRKRK